MARTDNDTCDPASSAAGATGIAAGFALANRVVNPPIEDPYVERLTRAYDLPAALKRAGLDPAKPTALSAEGLLFPPPDTQDRLLDNFTALIATGSRLASKSLPNIGQVVDMTELPYLGDLDDAASPFAALPRVTATRKWSVVIESPTGPEGIQ